MFHTLGEGELLGGAAGIADVNALVEFLAGLLSRGRGPCAGRGDQRGEHGDGDDPMGVITTHEAHH